MGGAAPRPAPARALPSLLVWLALTVLEPVCAVPRARPVPATPCPPILRRTGPGHAPAVLGRWLWHGSPGPALPPHPPPAARPFPDPGAPGRPSPDSNFWTTAYARSLGGAAAVVAFAAAFALRRRRARGRPPGARPAPASSGVGLGFRQEHPSTAGHGLGLCDRCVDLRVTPQTAEGRPWGRALRAWARACGAVRPHAGPAPPRTPAPAPSVWAAAAAHPAPRADPPRAAVIFLHGSGDDGAGLRSALRFVWGGRFLRRMEARGVRLVFPTARPRPYTLAGGRVASVWFDRRDLPPTAPEHTASVLESCARIDAAVEDLRREGVPAGRIAVGGFSMGGGIAMQYGYRTPHRLAAVFALSSYLTHDAAVYEAMRRRPPQSRRFPPLFQRHGAADAFIRPQWGRATADRLASLGVAVDFGVVQGLQHQLADCEMEQLDAFLADALTETEGPGTEG